MSPAAGEQLLVRLIVVFCVICFSFIVSPPFLSLFFFFFLSHFFPLAAFKFLKILCGFFEYVCVL